MKKVFLLSLLIPISFNSSVTHADAKRIAGITTGVISAVSGLLTVALVNSRIDSERLVAAGASLVSLSTGLASLALLNPTPYSSATVGKLEVAACASLVAATIAFCSAKAYREREHKNCNKTECSECNENNNFTKKYVMYTAIPAVIAAGAVYSALDSNWHLKV